MDLSLFCGLIHECGIAFDTIFRSLSQKEYVSVSPEVAPPHGHTC